MSTQSMLYEDEPENENDWLGQSSPAAEYDADYSKRALDELYHATRLYQNGEAINELYGFIRRFRFYAPYNALLLHVQNPGTTYAMPPRRWLKEYDRTIKPGGRPLVILQPMGPVLFVFDVSDTEPRSPVSPPLPKQITDPFEPKGVDPASEYGMLKHNAIRDGVLVTEAHSGSNRAGSIMRTRTRGHLIPYSAEILVERRFDMLLNAGTSTPARFATLTHELAHLYCGHLGIPSPKEQWWPDRRGMSVQAIEFEAESVAHLVCGRLGVDPISERYLSGYLGADKQLPEISLDRILTVAGLIERMCKEKIPPSRSPKRPFTKLEPQTRP